MKYIFRAVGQPPREARVSYGFLEEARICADEIARMWKRPVEIWRDRPGQAGPVDTVGPSE